VVQTFFACNDEWKDEQYEKYVSFVRSGFVNIYLNYNSNDGVVKYKIPVEVSGSILNDRNIQVTIGIDPDTLQAMNVSRYYNREDLFFRLLEPQYYTMNSMTTTIPAGSDVGYIDISFKIGNLDLVEKYVLPLVITETSEYIPSPKKWYRRSLMRIVPFNDYSGTYSATGGRITEGNNDMPTSVDMREMRVVDQNSVFFYAGLTEEEARNRALYKVKAIFNPSAESPDEGTITLSAYEDAIGFTSTPANCYYTVETRMDDLQPYLQIKTITLFLKYSYDDISNPNYKVRYNFDGSYVLERRRNTQIPDEDQQYIFDF
jgi:hypothetical protein